MPVEFSSNWIRPFYQKLQRTYESSSVLFDENPVEVFNRNVWVHAFHEPDPQGLIDIGIPVDHIMFGSDFPHPEGMADPLAYSEVVGGPSFRPAGADHGRVLGKGDARRQVRLAGLVQGRVSALRRGAAGEIASEYQESVPSKGRREGRPAQPHSGSTQK